MNIKPLNGWMVIKAHGNKESAVVTTENPDEQRGTVVARSSKFVHAGNMFTISDFDLKEGDNVIFLKHKGKDTPKDIEDQGYLLIHYLDVVGVENVT